MRDNWAWSDPGWRDRVDDDAVAAYREALRRAVDLRDTIAEHGDSAGSRAVFLVDVLNHLGDLLSASVPDPQDLWTLP